MIQDLSSHLGISKTTVHTFVKKEYSLSKLAPKFVPCLLTDEEEKARKHMCQRNFDSLKEDTDFINKIISSNESWVSVFKLELKKDSRQWLLKGSQQCPIKALRNRSTTKVMATVFMDTRGVV